MSDLQPRLSGPIVPIRTGGSRTPLFLIHGVDGDVDRFGALVNHVDSSWPVYGIRAQGLLKQPRALTRVEDMAAYYVEELRRIQKCGPYRFLGFSFGGLIAFEMARQLCTQGERVGMLAMLDNRHMASFSLLGGKVGIQKPIGEDAAGEGIARSKSHLKRLLAQGGLKYIREKLRARSFRGIYTTFDALHRPIPRFLQRAYDLNWFAAIRYLPAPYPGPIILFQSTQRNHDGGPKAGSWEHLAQSVEVREIEGGHEDIFNEPFVQGLAKQVNECLGA